jgi:DNA-binding CsgD family transcriptional regulator
VDPGENRYLGDLGEALARLGRTAEAVVLADELEGLGRSLERPSAIAVALRVRALAALESGEIEAALETLDRALVHHDAVAIPFDRARTLLALGTAQRRMRQRKAARQTLQDAVATFEKLGAALWTAKARAELGRIGGRTPSASGLTPTEQRVADLVSGGKSNKEVAAELVVSVHTVEAVLTSIYRKLDVRSRTEMAAKLADAS